MLVWILFPGNPTQSNNVFDQQFKPAFAEVAQMLRGRRCSTVAAMIVPVDRPAIRDESLDHMVVPADVFSHAVRDLNHAAHRSLALPLPAYDGHAVTAGK